MAEPSRRGQSASPRRRPAGRAKAAAPPVKASTAGGGAGGWLEMLTALVNAPVGVGRDQAARVQAAADGLDRFIENRIEDVLNRVNIPSRTDIERLNRSVDVLTTKVEALLSRPRGGS